MSRKGGQPLPRPFGLRDKFGYLMGDFGCNLSFGLITSYMMLFYTQYVGITLTHYGIIIIFTKIWDGINDPLIGALIDRFTPKKGDKFRPWIFWGSFPLAVASVLLFLDSHTLPYWARLVLCVVTYLIWDISYTIVNVPYGSLNSVMTADEIERSQLSTWRSFGAIVANIPIMIVVPLFAYKKEMVGGEEQSILQGGTLFLIALVLGAVSFVAFQVLYRCSTERVPHQIHDGQKFSYFKTLKTFFTNRTMLAVSLAALANVVFFMSTQTTNALVFQMYFGDGRLSSVAVVSMLLPMLIAAPLVKPAVKRFGKKALCSWPMLGSAFFFLLIMVLPIKSPVTFIVLLTLACTFSGFYMMVGWALVSDGIDSLEAQTGRREEGSVYATYSMIRKIGQGIGQSLVPFVLAAAIPGLDMNDAATWSVEYGEQIKFICALLPLIGALITFVAMQFLYDLNKEKTAELQKKLGRVPGGEDSPGMGELVRQSLQKED